MKQALVLAAAALGLLGASSAAPAGQFKNVQTNSVASPGCVTVHSSPQNQGSAMTAAMAIEVFEFITPAAGNYKCCIASNSTNRPLFVRLINLSGAAVSSFQTVANGAGCTAYAALSSPFAYQCTVATGPNLPVAANAHYTLQICRQ